MPTVNAEDIAPTPEAEAAPAPEAAPAEETDKKEETGGELSDELLTAAPALQLLMNGSPPATIAPKDAEFPELDTVAKHMKELSAAGFGVYPTKDKQNVVFYNALYVSPEDVKKADEDGKLDSIAVPYEELRTALSGEAAPVGGEASPAAPAAPAQAGSPPNASTENKLSTARTNNLSVGAPTSGPVPGQGRILNNILKPVV